MAIIVDVTRRLTPRLPRRAPPPPPLSRHFLLSVKHASQTLPTGCCTAYKDSWYSTLSAKQMKKKPNHIYTYVVLIDWLKNFRFFWPTNNFVINIISICRTSMGEKMGREEESEESEDDVVVVKY